MHTTSQKFESPELRAESSTQSERDAAAIAQAKAALDTAKQARRTAERLAEEAREGESAAAGRVAVTIAKAIEHGADPALVLPFEMLRAHRSGPRIIASAAELTAKRLGHSFSTTGSLFPGWMEITVDALFAHYMPTPLWSEWSEADRARRERMRQKPAA